MTKSLFILFHVCSSGWWAGGFCQTLCICNWWPRRYWNVSACETMEIKKKNPDKSLERLVARKRMQTFHKIVKWLKYRIWHDRLYTFHRPYLGTNWWSYEFFFWIIFTKSEFSDFLHVLMILLVGLQSQ